MPGLSGTVYYGCCNSIVAFGRLEYRTFNLTDEDRIIAICLLDLCIGIAGLLTNLYSYFRTGHS